MGLLFIIVKFVSTKPCILYGPVAYAKWVLYILKFQLYIMSFKGGILPLVATLEIPFITGLIFFGLELFECKSLGPNHRSMSESAELLDPAFEGVGKEVGTEIWRIENFQPVPVEKSSYGKFYSGDSYLVLQTSQGTGGAYQYDIHFWLGNNTSQDEAGAAAIKTVELDAVLADHAVQHRELQGFESDKFMSYFKRVIILEGGAASGFKAPEEHKFDTKLFVCSGDRVVKLKEVPVAASSLNHGDVFILDTKDKIYQFNGKESSIQERTKAYEVVQQLKDENHFGVCGTVVVDDTEEAETEHGEFWELLGGSAPSIGGKAISEDVLLESSAGKVYSITDGELNLEGDASSKAMLETNRCYLVDCGAHVFVWFGKATALAEKKAAARLGVMFLKKENKPNSVGITLVAEGRETQSFKSHFNDWETE